MSTSVESRFWAKVNKDGPVPDYRPDLGPCWLWTGFLREGGYGQFGRNERAYRVAYELTIGLIPDGLVLDHLCRVPQCVNPAHLEPVTTAENIRRGAWGWHNAKEAAKTECKRGHEYTPENTLIVNGHRACRICQRAAETRYRRRQGRSELVVNDRSRRDEAVRLVRSGLTQLAAADMVGVSQSCISNWVRAATPLRPDVRLDVEPLIDATRRRYGSVKKAGPNFSRRLYAMRRSGVSLDQADRWAIHLGLHPSAVWPDWNDHQEVAS